MKKMKVILVLLAIVTAIPFFSACKKGENDPFLSFRSRDARLMGEWKVSKIEGTSTADIKNYTTTGTLVTNSNTLTTTTTSFDGTTKTLTKVIAYSGNPAPSTTGKTITDNYSSTIELTIEEHGIAKVTETNKYNSTTQSTTPTNTCSGSTLPYYLGYDGAGLSCDGTYTETTTTTITNTYEGVWFWEDGKKNKEMLFLSGVGSMGGTYMITQLKNKEIVLTLNYVNNEIESGGDTDVDNYTSKKTVTLTAK